MIRLSYVSSLPTLCSEATGWMFVVLTFNTASSYRTYHPGNDFIKCQPLNKKDFYSFSSVHNVLELSVYHFPETKCQYLQSQRRICVVLMEILMQILQVK